MANSKLKHLKRQGPRKQPQAIRMASLNFDKFMGTMTVRSKKEIAADIAKLNKAVDNFAKQMKAKLSAKAKDGFHGWDHGSYTKDKIQKQILEQYCKMINGKNVSVDIANFCMFWDYHNYFTNLPKVSFTPKIR